MNDGSTRQAVQQATDASTQQRLRRQRFRIFRFHESKVTITPTQTRRRRDDLHAKTMQHRFIMAALLLVGSTAAGAKQIVCDTTVKVGDGKIVIDLWEKTAPIGAQRLEELVTDGFFTDLPFFRAIPRFLIQFGISPNTDMQAKWQANGNIADDPHPNIPFSDGIVSYAGYGKDTRSTHLFLTLGDQPGLGKSAWEVPVGKVVQGLDDMHAIYTGYGDGVNQGRLHGKQGAEYLKQFPLLDRFKSCVVTEGGGPDPADATARHEL